MHRSGSTLLGELLSYGSEDTFIFEPLHEYPVHLKEWEAWTRSLASDVHTELNSLINCVKVHFAYDHFFLLIRFSRSDPLKTGCGNRTKMCKCNSNC